MCSKHIVQVFLLSSIVLALTHDSHAEQVPVKLKARFCVVHHNGSVINSKEQFRRRSAPFSKTFVWWKLQDLQWVPIGIFEVEGADSSRIVVPVRKALRAGRGMLDSVLAKPCVSFVHIRDNDGDVLKRPVITACVCWNRTAFGGEILGQLNLLVAELHAHHSHP